jgi:hypothetical protein
MTSDHDSDGATGDGDDALARHLEPYFASRAAHITPPAADVGAVLHRARRRRRRRGAALAAFGSVALLAATVAVVRTHGTEYPVAVGAVGTDTEGTDTEGTGPDDTTSPPSPLQWQLVRPHAGLGFNGDTASAAGATYSISTAPGTTTNNLGFGQTLYRTTDGVEWSPVATPTGFATATLGGTSDRVYALGTMPAGGSTGISLLSGGTSGDLGPPVSLPIDLAALSHDAGGDVSMLSGSVAAGHGHVVVAVTVQSDLQSVVHDAAPQIDPDHYLIAKGDGVDEGPSLKLTPGQTITTKPPGSVPTTPAPLRHWSFDELGINSTQRAYLAGRTLLFDSTDGTTFRSVDPPAGADGTARVVPTPDGFRLVSTDSLEATTKVFRSTDVSSWSPAVATFAGALDDAGVIDGHFVVATAIAIGAPVIHREQAGGTWSDLSFAGLDPNASTPAAYHGWIAAAIGPLGVAAVAWMSTGTTMTGTVIYSQDGTHATAVPVPTTSDGVPTWMGSVQVGADAITVGLSLGRTAQPDGTPAMADFVGTP